MEIEKLKKMYGEFNGNKSVLYPYIKNEIKKMGYCPEELPFEDEFICFDEDYIRYVIDIKERNNKIKRVVDIGCQYGFQSYLFDDFDYTGIESANLRHIFFNNHTTYTTGCFPHVDINLSNCIVISNMSLGYFNSDRLNINNRNIAKKLSEADYLYIATTKELLTELKNDFVVIKTFNNSIEFPRMYLENKRIFNK